MVQLNQMGHKKQRTFAAGNSKDAPEKVRALKHEKDFCTVAGGTIEVQRDEGSREP